jgi:type III pantothenate kinase
MLLAVEVGNTHTKLALFDRDRLAAEWRVLTLREAGADDHALSVEGLLAARGFDRGDVDGVAISAVVPSVQQALEAMARGLFGVRALTVRAGADSPIPLVVDHPAEVGPDRIANAVAAHAAYGAPVIVIDLGTATNFDCVNVRGEFVGGAIAPGLAVGADALFARAARLARVDIAMPHEAIGRDTAANLRSGIVYGYAGLVDGMVDRMKAEMAGTPLVVATGGFAPLVARVARSIDRLQPGLTMEGLRLIHARARTATPSPSPGAPPARPR